MDRHPLWSAPQERRALFVRSKGRAIGCDDTAVLHGTLKPRHYASPDESDHICVAMSRSMRAQTCAAFHILLDRSFKNTLFTLRALLPLLNIFTLTKMLQIEMVSSRRNYFKLSNPVSSCQFASNFFTC